MLASYLSPSCKSTDPTIRRISSDEYPLKQWAAVRTNFFVISAPVQICLSSSRYQSCLVTMDTTNGYFPPSTLVTLLPLSGSALVEVRNILPEFGKIYFYEILNKFQIIIQKLA